MLRLVSALALVNALLMAPQWVSAGIADEPAAWIALEAALIVGLFSLLPRQRWIVALAWVAAFGVVLATLVGLADLVFQVSLARSLNLFLDLYLVRVVGNLAVGNLGMPKTVFLMIALVLALALALWGLARLLASPAGKVAAPPPAARRLAPKIAGILLVALFALGLTHATPATVQGRLALPVVHLARAQAVALRDTWREKERFQAELAQPDSYADVPGLLSRLQKMDVLLTFIESYGMAALTDPEFAAVIRPRLDTLALRMQAAGIHLATGTLASSTIGGQSWYAHGSTISGRWISNQLRYDLLMASDRETMVDDFHHAGHRTITLMPAITMTWPEGVRLRYDEVFTRQNIPYAGPPFYWVTMPDQYTWSYLADVRARAGGRPLFVETAMVSSHAPWTPILPMVPWDEIGDGSRFAPFEQQGHPPEELWVDIDKLRHDYALSLDYSLQAMTGFAERYLDARTLLIVLGDHQAAPWVTNDTVSTVPVHVFTRDPALLEPFLAWGFRGGALPDAAREPARMDQFRGWFVRAFSDPSAAQEARP